MDAPSLDRSYFQRVYSASDDPWHFATSAYEAEKYDRTLQMLGTGQYARALEIGCSIGVLTERLADRADRLLSLDLNERALELARLRCAGRANVTFENRAVPADFPLGSFDLVLISEVGYYWSDGDLASAIDAIAKAALGGTVELVHYLPKVAEYPRDGDSVHAAFRADPRYTLEREYRGELYRIDVFAVV